MRLLTAIDQLFILLENRNQPMHIGGLFLFEIPDGASDTFVSDLVQQMVTQKRRRVFRLTKCYII